MEPYYCIPVQSMSSFIRKNKVFPKTIGTIFNTQTLVNNMNKTEQLLWTDRDHVVRFTVSNIYFDKFGFGHVGLQSHRYTSIKPAKMNTHKNSAALRMLTRLAALNKKPSKAPFPMPFHAERFFEILTIRLCWGAMQ